MPSKPQRISALSDQAILLTDEELRNLEDALGIPAGFLQALRAEDDWSFVIKGHALLEAALALLLTRYLGQPAILQFLEYLETSNTRTGKVALISRLKLLTANQIRFIRKFSELRNDLVHNISNFAFQLSNHLSTKSNNELKDMAGWVIYFPVQIVIDDRKLSPAEALKSDPKLHFWIALVEVLSRVQIRLKLVEKSKPTPHGAAGVHIRDDEAQRLAREVAMRANVGLSEAVHLALTNELRRREQASPLWERTAGLRARVAGRVKDPRPVDKAFRDDLYEDRSPRVR